MTTLVLACRGGRYPYPVGPHRREAITASITVNDGVVVVRIDDEDHPERWEEFTCSLSDLGKFVQAAQSS